MESYARYFLLVVCEIILWAGKKTLIFKNRRQQDLCFVIEIYRIVPLASLDSCKTYPLFIYFYNGVCSISKAFIVLVSFGFVASVAPFFSFTETLKYRGYVLHPGNLDRINNISQNSEAGV